ncbi:MAG: Gfo/Idh/MocA family oxidoreductase [Zavarzinella sp.]
MNFPNRRTFLLSGVGALASTPILFQSELKAAPSERLRVGVVGFAGRGSNNLSGVAAAGAEITALCDVHESRTAEGRKTYPKAKFYKDFRKMLDAGGLDAVVCSTADHTHFHVAYHAMQGGLHVYCEKPLTHTVWEARTLINLAKKKKLVTQMGTQIHAGDNYRRVVELVRSGAIGKVTEAHCWVPTKYSGNGQRPPAEKVPADLDWDLWLGPVADRPYSSAYVPFRWRHYWAFGSGALSDMACHHMDLPFWALGLRHPAEVSAVGSEVTPETCADWTTVTWKFSETKAHGPITLTWYDGGKQPRYFAEKKLPPQAGGTLFVGEKGMLLADYGRRKLFPEKDFQGIDGDGSIPKSVGHHKEWVDACKTGAATTCNFDYSGTLTETVLLGVVAYRTGKALRWDADKLQTNHPEANALLTKEYRIGWEIEA